MKVVGYLVAILGLVFLVNSKFSFLEKWISFIPVGFFKYSVYIGVGLIVIGFVLSREIVRQKTTHTLEDVPIYHGKKIVGYRRS